MSDTSSDEEPKSESDEAIKPPRTRSILRKPSTGSPKSSKSVSISDDLHRPTGREQRLNRRLDAPQTRQSESAQGDIMLEYSYASASTRRTDAPRMDYNSSQNCAGCSLI
jgi:hypothetical protein